MIKSNRYLPKFLFSCTLALTSPLICMEKESPESYMKLDAGGKIVACYDGFGWCEKPQEMIEKDYREVGAFSDLEKEQKDKLSRAIHAAIAAGEKSELKLSFVNSFVCMGIPTHIVPIDEGKARVLVKYWKYFDRSDKPHFGPNGNNSFHVK